MENQRSPSCSAPPGYVGYGEGGRVTTASGGTGTASCSRRDRKAHPDLINILLSIFDDGRASDAFGGLVDFKNTIIIMTSNVGSRELLVEKNLGFVEQHARPDAKSGDAYEGSQATVPPEFLNRIDEIVVFNRLGDDELRKIVRLLVEDLNVTLQKHRLIESLTDAACDRLEKTTLRDRAYRARPLRRAIQKQ